MCGLANTTALDWACPPWGCPPMWRGPSTSMLLPSLGDKLTVRTSAYPLGTPSDPLQGPATSCTLVLPPQVEGLSMQVAFKSFRLNSRNFFSVQEFFRFGTFDPQRAPYLLAAASGTAPPPSVRGGPGSGLVLTYYAPTPDDHDPALCDGVTLEVSYVPSAPSLAACSLATTCGACASIPGCAWCDTSGLYGACLYTGTAPAPAVQAASSSGTSTPGISFTLSPSPALASVLAGEPGGVLCNASLAYTAWAQCPGASELALTATLVSQAANDAQLAGLRTRFAADAPPSVSAGVTAALTLPPIYTAALSLPVMASPLASVGIPVDPFGPGVVVDFSGPLMQALGTPAYSVAMATLQKANLADVVLARFAFLALCCAFLVLFVVFNVMVQAKRAVFQRTGKQVKWVLEVYLIVLCLCKAVEFLALTLLTTMALGDLAAQATPGNIAILYSTAAYAADLQYVLITVVAYNTSPIVPNSKHSFCALMCVLMPGLLASIIVAVLMHYSRVSAVLPPQAPSPFPALEVDLCLVALPTATISGATMAQPQVTHLSLVQVFAAVLYLASTLSSQTFALVGIASEDLVTTSPLKLRPPLLKTLGSLLSLLSLPVEVSALWTVRCLGMASTVQNMVAAAHVAPSAVLLFGVFTALLALSWQMYIDSRAVAGSIKEGLRLNIAREGPEGDKASALVAPEPASKK